ncbi:hypothetical protein [Hallella bergensis]|nr:hypothetical protein [Hallella bergensis]
MKHRFAQLAEKEDLNNNKITKNEQQDTIGKSKEYSGLADKRSEF